MTTKNTCVCRYDVSNSREVIPARGKVDQTRSLRIGNGGGCSNPEIAQYEGILGGEAGPQNGEPLRIPASDNGAGLVLDSELAE